MFCKGFEKKTLLSCKMYTTENKIPKSKSEGRRYVWKNTNKLEQEKIIQNKYFP